MRITYGGVSTGHGPRPSETSSTEKMFGSVLAALLVLATQQCAAESPSIQFSPLPSISASISAPKDTSNGLGGFYDLAGGIVDAIRPGNLPHGRVC